MKNMSFVLIGALISAFFGFLYMKEKKGTLRNIVDKFLKINPALQLKEEESSEKTLETIKKGENEKVEFKTTLRTNLHTKKPDRKVENATLKTIVSFLNSEGGILFIGITDKGEIEGIEKDGFENKDKYMLHFVNIIKKRIGKEFIPFISFKIIKLKEKNILKVACEKSKKLVFLKIDEEEKFYIRAGPSSTEIKGRNLIEYIEHRFRRKDSE